MEVIKTHNKKIPKKRPAHRPKKKESERIDDELRKYYDDFKSILYTAEKTGHDKMTVWKHFKRYGQEHLEEETEDFINRQKDAKEKGMKMFDELIDEANDALKDIMNVDSADELGVHKARIAVIHELATLYDKRMTIQSAATVDMVHKTLKGYQDGMDKKSGKSKERD